MRYKDIREGIFINRVNRFGAYAKVGERTEYVHVKNTGRCREILVPGTKVYLEPAANTDRKTGFSIVSAFKGDMLVNIDSQVTNTVMHEALSAGTAYGFPNGLELKREAVYGNSRFDFKYEDAAGIGYIEVKGVTLDSDGIALFPDAPTERGRKHLRELAEARAGGYGAHVVFVIQYSPAVEFRPNGYTDPDFRDALVHAQRNGVLVHAYDCAVSPGGISLGRRVPVSVR